MDRRLIDHFVNANLLSRQDMQRAILRASKDKTGVVTQLLDARLIDEEILAEQIAEFYQHEMLDLAGFRVDPSALRMITEGIALKAGAMPYAYERGTDRLMLVTYDPERAREVIEMLTSATGQAPHISIAPRVWVERMIPYSYQSGPQSGPTPTLNAPSGRNSSGAGFMERPKSGINRMRRRQNDSTNPPTAQAPPRSGDVEGALDDFEDFLKDEAPVLSPRSSFAGRPTSHLGIEPVVQQQANRRRRQQPRTQNPMDESAFGNLTGGPAFWEDDSNLKQRWGWEDPEQASRGQAPPQPPEPAQDSGFSLFEQSEEPKPKAQMTLQEIVEMHNRKINSLREESQRQREVIQALADLLVEARVISRRELKKKLREMRKDE